MDEFVNDRIDEFEVALSRCEPFECEVKHAFLFGLYIRKILMPAGKDGKIHWVTSRVHNTTHPFYVTQGKVAVFNENDGEQFIEAPFEGLTKPNTRRVLRIVEDTVWLTVHRTDIVPENDSKEAIEAAAAKVGEQILMPYENKLIGGHFVNNIFMPTVKEIE